MEVMLSLSFLSLFYDEFIKNEENTYGVLNTKLLNQKNVDLWTCINYCQQAVSNEMYSKRLVDMEKIIERSLLKYSHDINLDKQLIIDWMHQFQKFKEDRREKEKLQTVVVTFLKELPDIPLLDISVLTNHWD